MNGLQSTLLQYKPKANVPPTNQLQVIHSRGDHWIVASTVGCTGDEVLVCDSLYGTLDTSTVNVISNLFLLRSKCLIAKSRKEVKTVESAIAYATAIGHGVDPASIKLNQAAMRRHLIKCFEENLYLFPSA